MPRQTFATINLSAVVANYQQAQALAPASKTMAVIKADAYGHGMLAVAEVLAPIADGFAVAFVDEAVALRQAGCRLPILVLEGAHEPADLAIAHQYDLWIVVHQPEHFAWITAVDYAIQYWFKLDTGMHRLGLSVAQLQAGLAQLPASILQNSMLMSHFACADQPEQPLNAAQIQQIHSLAQHYQLPVSLANSAGIIEHSQAHMAWNRLGIALYGGYSHFRPVMTLSSVIIGLRTIADGEAVGYGQTWTATRKTRIATVAIGYGDGYPRHAPNGTPAILHGQRIALVGRVSMDMLTFDVTDCTADIQLGDQVELWGDNIHVSEIAEEVNTINYELLTRIAPRVTKQYKSTN